MPRKVFDSFVRDLKRDLRVHGEVGSRYLSTRDIARRFSVSLQTAQKGVRELCRLGMVRAAPRAGITVTSLEPQAPLSGRHIVMVSNHRDRRFNEAFLGGAAEVAVRERVSVELIESSRTDTTSTTFGEYLLGLRADGVVALAFHDAALGFYHAMREGLDVVADIILDELPQLPAVQTDNVAHARAAGTRMVRRGYRRMLVVGYYPAGNTRHLGFETGAEETGAETSYVCLRNPDAVRTIDHFFYFMDDSMAVFSCDYASNYVVAAKFAQHGIGVRRDNFMVYDSEEEHFHYPGLPSVPSAGPSLKVIGGSLVEALLRKWREGTWQQPLQRRL